MNRAILLIGPTGSGKTPLGEILAAKGFRGKRTWHFDFGENLRLVAKGRAYFQTLTAEEVDFVRRVLDAGTLLENSRFQIAAKIFRSYLVAMNAAESDWVVLNGLPRHVDQARAVSELVTVEQVINLSCSPEDVLARLRSDVGGDRGGRSDDDLVAVTRKLEIFSARTRSLIEHFQRQGVDVTTLDIGAHTTPAEAMKQLRQGFGREKKSFL